MKLKFGDTSLNYFISSCDNYYSNYFKLFITSYLEGSEINCCKYKKLV